MSSYGDDLLFILPPDSLNIAEILETSYIYGPGKRFVIWVQGCRIGCKGCWNTSMLSFEEKRIWNIDDLYGRIILVPEIEGITILGGEPLHQSRSLVKLVRKLKAIDLTVMLYTGFEIPAVTDQDSLDLLSLSDIVIAGPFVEELRSTSLKWRGSSNQEVMISNKAYQKKYASFPEETEVELHVDELGRITLAGYPDSELLEEVLD